MQARDRDTLPEPMDMEPNTVGLAFLGFTAAFGAIRPSGLDDIAKDAIKAVIERQISAFKGGDARMALACASPGMRRHFGAQPEAFDTMVRARYRAIHSPQRLAFDGLKMTPHGLIQAVTLVCDRGARWLAFYAMGREQGGAWKINSVHVSRVS
jgi:hypothetical protein